MPLNDFLVAVSEVRPLIELIGKGSLRRRSLTEAGFDAALLQPATAGSIVLIVGRFEQFMKDIGNKALDQYGRANPPLGRSSLSLPLQVKILSANISAAARRKEYGVTVADVDRIREIDRVANNIAEDKVWGDNAIETFSNPNSSTVQSILNLLGVPTPWLLLEAEFAGHWASVRTSEPQFKAIPHAQNELDSILTWRNGIAHTNTLPSVGHKELIETAAFFECLARAIDDVLQNHVNSVISAAGSSFAPW